NSERLVAAVMRRAMVGNFMLILTILPVSLQNTVHVRGAELMKFVEDWDLSRFARPMKQSML
ncbi:MAG: hypothetical protein ABI557_02330, partial [Aureliella sp.]